ncbi:MAG TPA: ATP-binding protein [Candidatus Hydrogenedens sp.]|nr:ATP-binding protein [Candidatus Hydrogenedens sp.]HOK09293.1 ATP-binding protein [Candidatus Hydrogenedens sp.]HOL19879.1 ATP-binding protein [Candidatus Hydrogenedens sp.]HPP59802.1 ATP-binding protein [Candidatus Hydrogenedens sp.]
MPILIEISLHILDLLENSINAGADKIWITIDVNENEDMYSVCVEDNGKGFSIEAEQILDPFYTTKSSKIVGLGLSLARDSAEQSGGKIEIGKSEKLGGAKVVLTFQISHIDRVPMGDLGNTISGIFLTNPNVNINIHIIKDNQHLLLIDTNEYKNMCRLNNELECSQRIAYEINEVVKKLGI